MHEQFNSHTANFHSLFNEPVQVVHEYRQSARPQERVWIFINFQAQQMLIILRRKLELICRLANCNGGNRLQHLTPRVNMLGTMLELPAGCWPAASWAWGEYLECEAAESLGKVPVVWDGQVLENIEEEPTFEFCRKSETDSYGNVYEPSSLGKMSLVLLDLY